MSDRPAEGGIDLSTCQPLSGVPQNCPTKQKYLLTAKHEVAHVLTLSCPQKVQVEVVGQKQLCLLLISVYYSL